ncbi:signal recognition particle-docking protein FtsY [Criibacterium bergeronii]|uniref:Signal recognition particle receptor FtsY n=1 Tax=Criibacterium bergeronii TaxID=1871336 RepID=A0A371IMG7_9FIRM|nr:signal recognition particle-docking protein FtsY [Criibacterium bergeronii]MBS6062312.1 signal recognition particle-docking protein FtsY [Peptostreptococcaceae bacterium]RDY21661.1 signal recognition particle-docking protein FtsY [Criibacterium bergeronii]TRW28569.1 signal recognition particle-docking protein FtsY [Criibacterium bergeronii]
MRKKKDESKSLGFFARLKQGLQKTGQNFSDKFDNLFKNHIEIDEDLYEEIEEVLITSDISYETTLNIVEKLKQNIKKHGVTEVDKVHDELKNTVYELIQDNNSSLDTSSKSVIIVVGVNGVGKTTTIGKIALKLKNEGKSVLLAAGDTFRAAAEEQLEVWAERAGTTVVSHSQGADPSAVIYDAVQKAKSQGTDVLICDTAGRLHNKKNLMKELEKIIRTVDKEYPEAKKQVLLVIDATTGQNALNQVSTFGEVTKLDGIVLTKLDGTAKGGIILSVIDEYKVPVKFVGVGEKVEDLQIFDAKNFVDAIFEKSK